MPRQGNHQLLMGLFKEINLGNKLDSQLFLPQIKNSFVIELYKSSNKKYVDLIYYEFRENLMFVMLMVGLL